MGWRSTLVLAALVVAIGAYVWFSAPPAGGRREAGQNRPSEADAVQALPKLLVFEPADVVALQLQRAGQTWELRRHNGTWQGIEDATAVDDFLRTVSQLRALMDIPAAAQDLATFGLEPPLGVIVLRVASEPQPLVLQIGARNPATTGVYVKIGEAGPVALAGALIEWEFDNFVRRLHNTQP